MQRLTRHVSVRNTNRRRGDHAMIYTVGSSYCRKVLSLLLKVHAVMLRLSVMLLGRVLQMCGALYVTLR